MVKRVRLLPGDLAGIDGQRMPAFWLFNNDITGNNDEVAFSFPASVSVRCPCTVLVLAVRPFVDGDCKTLVVTSEGSIGWCWQKSLLRML